MAQASFEKSGIRVLTDTAVEGLKKGKSGLTAAIAGKSQSFDAAILSVGVSGNVDGLGLVELGVSIERNFIVVDEVSARACREFCDW